MIKTKSSSIVEKADESPTPLTFASLGPARQSNEKSLDVHVERFKDETSRQP